MSPAPEAQARRIADAIEALPESGYRRLVAIAGPPGSGKSTVSEALLAELSRRGIATGLLPMDGFHYDNAILDARGLRPRKGAPETFDAAGFRAMLARLATEAEVAVPRFDRALDTAIAASAVIGPEARTVIVEGNYLLLRDPAWAPCRAFWALSVFLDVPLPELEARLIRRWRDHGLNPDAARARALGNDIPNAKRVIAESTPADIVLKS